MKQKIIKLLCEKFNEEKNVMKVFVEITLQKSYSLEQTRKLIEEFYQKRITN